MISTPSSRANCAANRPNAAAFASTFNRSRAHVRCFSFVERDQEALAVALPPEVRGLGADPQLPNFLAQSDEALGEDVLHLVVRLHVSSSAALTFRALYF